MDAESLYDVLENEIIPRFYDRDDDGVPRGWIASMKQSMSTLAPTWDSLRMTRDYTESYYLPGFAKVRQLQSGGAKSARDRAKELARLRESWPSTGVKVTHRNPISDKSEQVELMVQLGGLDPADVLVQLWIDSATAAPAPGNRYPRERTGLSARYVAIIDWSKTAEPEELVARILPSPVHTDAEALPGLITWSQ